MNVLFDIKQYDIQNTKNIMKTRPINTLCTHQSLKYGLTFFLDKKRKGGQYFIDTLFLLSEEHKPVINIIKPQASVFQTVKTLI